jgi:hypothetical protein
MASPLHGGDSVRIHESEKLPRLLYGEAPAS